MDNEKIVRELVKIAKELESGIWGLPKNESDVKNIVKYIKKMKSGKKPVSSNEEITDVFYSLIGDDDLFDKLDDAKKHYLQTCAEIIIDKIKEMVKGGVDSFRDNDDYQRLVSVLKKIK